MREEDLKRGEAVSDFVKKPSITVEELSSFLTNWAAHPDYHVEFTSSVVQNLSALNIKLLNDLAEDKRFHLLMALCLAVEIALSMKMWEHDLGRKDGAWYWNNLGLFFSSLHGLIPPLNALQKHVSLIEQDLTGRIVCLEGPSEHRFLELLHYATRILGYDNHYFVYGGKGAQKNLVYFIRDKNEKGVRVDLAYDGDSNFSGQIPKLQQQVAIRRVFRFERDFESAFPPELLARAVTAYLKRFKEDTSECSIEEVKSLLAQREPFVKAVEEQYGVSISKPTLGELLAIELLRLADQDHRVLTGAGSLTGSELSRFLRFVINWPEDVSPEENQSEEDISF